MTGIYMIMFGDGENAYFYIGQSVNIERRKNKHLSELRHGHHRNPYMQSVFNECGEKSITFEVLCECTKEKLHELEEYYIYTMYTFIGDNPHGLNLNTGGSGDRNFLAETRKRMGKASIGRKKSAEERAKISEAGRRKKLSDETKAKISKARKGKKTSEETKQKLRTSRKCKPVLCVELGKTFPSIRAANRFVKEEFGIDTKVCEVLAGRRNTAGGFHWEYYLRKEDV